LVLAVNEAVACATGRAPGIARVRLWRAGGRVFCQAHGDSLLVHTLCPDYGPPAGGDEAEVMRRLLLRRLSDWVTILAGPRGKTVMLSMTVA
jgi:hypothetical protein